jgi:hypothetical protein
MGYSFGEVTGKIKKNFKLQKNVTRLISNAGRDTTCRVLFKKLSILPLLCMYIMEIVYYIKMNIGGLEQNSVRHNYNTCHRLDLPPQFCRTDSLKKKSVNNMGVKLYNKLPNHLKNLENLQLFRKKLKFFPITKDLLSHRRISVI